MLLRDSAVDLWTDVLPSPAEVRMSSPLNGFFLKGIRSESTGSTGYSALTSAGSIFNV